MLSVVTKSEVLYIRGCCTWLEENNAGAFPTTLLLSTYKVKGFCLSWWFCWSKGVCEAETSVGSCEAKSLGFSVKTSRNTGTNLWPTQYLILVVKQVVNQLTGLTESPWFSGTSLEMSLGCSVSWLPWKKGLDQFSLDHLAEGNTSCSSLLWEQPSEFVTTFSIFSKLPLLP